MTAKSLLGAAILMSIGLGPMPAVAEDMCVVTGDRYAGCKSQTELNKLNRYAAAGDKAAWSNTMAGHHIIGECTVFKKGETVFVIDAAASGLSKVRRKGEIIQYWTSAKAVKPVRD